MRNTILLSIICLASICLGDDYIFEDTISESGVRQNHNVGQYGPYVSPEEAVKVEGENLIVNTPSAAVNIHKNVTVNIENTTVQQGDLHINAGNITEKNFGNVVIAKGSTLWLETEQDGYYPDHDFNNPFENNARTEILGNTITFGDVVSNGNININNNRYLWVKFPSPGVSPEEKATGTVSAKMDSLVLGTGSKITMVGNASLTIGDLNLGNNSNITLEYYLSNPYIEHNGLQPANGYEIIDYTMMDGISRPLVTITGNMVWNEGSWVVADMKFTESSTLDFKGSVGALDTGYRAWRTSDGATYCLPRFEMTEGMTLSLSDLMYSELYDAVGSDWSENARTKLIKGEVVGAVSYNGTTLFDEKELINDDPYQAFIKNVSFNGLNNDYEYQLELNSGEVYLWARQTTPIPEPVTLIMLLSSLLFFANKRGRS